MYNPNLLYCSLRSEQGIRLPFGYAQGKLNPLGIAKVSVNLKINAYKSVTDGYTKLLGVIKSN